MNKSGFTLIELLAVIIILAVIAVIGMTTVLPYMSESREKAFRIEATNVVKAAEKALRLYTIGEASLKNNQSSCAKSSDGSICYTVAELISLGIYDGDSDAYSGKVIIQNAASKTPTYVLYLNKSSEFKIIEGTQKTYDKLGSLSTDNWSADDYEACNCSNS